MPKTEKETNNQDGILRYFLPVYIGTILLIFPVAGYVMIHSADHKHPTTNPCEQYESK